MIRTGTVAEPLLRRRGTRGADGHYSRGHRGGDLLEAGPKGRRAPCRTNKTWIARLAETLTEISRLFSPLEKIACRLLALLGVIDLLVHVWRVL